MDNPAMATLTAIDLWVSGAMSAIVGHSAVLDGVLLRAFQTDLLKLFPMVAVLLVLSRTPSRRETGVAGLLGASLALVGATIAQPFGSDRVRPALSGLFRFPALPVEAQTDVVSFPSETAAMACALAAALARYGPGHAWLAWIWSVVAICLPRLYGGYHYVSDLIAGAVIGVVACYLILATGLVRRVAAALDRAGPTTRTAAQLLLIVYAFELSRSFGDLRIIAGR